MENAILEGYRIGYKNFSGKPDQFNREGDRNFVVFLDEETADILEKDGWNVKRPKPSPDPEIVREPYLPVKVNFNGRPPTVVTITNQGEANENIMRHTEDTVSSLDHLDIRECDLIISPYHYDFAGRQGISAYLQTLYAKVEVDPFYNKYYGGGSNFDVVSDEDLPF